MHVPLAGREARERQTTRSPLKLLFCCGICHNSHSLGKTNLMAKANISEMEKCSPSIGGEEAHSSRKQQHLLWFAFILLILNQIYYKSLTRLIIKSVKKTVKSCESHLQSCIKLRIQVISPFHFYFILSSKYLDLYTDKQKHTDMFSFT